MHVLNSYCLAERIPYVPKSWHNRKSLVSSMNAGVLVLTPIVNDVRELLSADDFSIQSQIDGGSLDLLKLQQPKPISNIGIAENIDSAINEIDNLSNSLNNE